MKKKRIILLAGAPGSGKTTIAQHLSEKTSISYYDIDDIPLKEGRNLQGKDLWDKFYELYSGVINNDEEGIFIGTLNLRETRDIWRELAIQNGYDFIGIFFDLPKDLIVQRCLERNVWEHTVNASNAIDILDKWYKNLGDIESYKNNDLGKIWYLIKDPHNTKEAVSQIVLE